MQVYQEYFPDRKLLEPANLDASSLCPHAINERSIDPIEGLKSTCIKIII
jgi:hypothetical protein